MGPDLRPDTSGYDNAGLFGPAFANLGGDHYTLTWTLGPIVAPQYGLVQDVILTINGFTYDMAAVPLGDQISASGQYGVDTHGNLNYATFSSMLSTPPIGAPNFAGPTLLADYSIRILPGLADPTNIGQATLAIRGHPYETTINFAIPNPELGSGIVGLLTLALIIGAVAPRQWRRQR